MGVEVKGGRRRRRGGWAVWRNAKESEWTKFQILSFELNGQFKIQNSELRTENSLIPKEWELNKLG